MNYQLKMAARMLDTWKVSYLRARARVEANRNFSVDRWEFDKANLFSETEYIGEVIRDLERVFQTVRHYKNLFVGNLKKIIQHSSECKTFDEKITNLTVPIEKVDFDIYLEIFKDEWQEILGMFEQNVVEMDQRLKILIIKTFTRIKSVSEAVQIVEDISRIQTRKTVCDSVPYICNKIIIHFTKDIKLSDQIFQKHKSMECSRMYKIYELVCWAEHLIENLRSKLHHLKNVAFLSTSSTLLFHQTTEEFQHFELTVRDYISSMCIQWYGDAVALLAKIMNENVIDLEQRSTSTIIGEYERFENMPVITATAASIRNGDGNDDVDNLEYEPTGNPLSGTQRNFSIGVAATTLKWITKKKNRMEGSRRKVEHVRTKPWQEFQRHTLLIERGLKFRTNIPKEIMFDVIENCNLLRRNNVELPEEITNFLFVKERLYEHVKIIDDITNKYEDLIDGLGLAEVWLMKRYLTETEIAIQFGQVLYTWNSVVLRLYCRSALEKCEQVISLKYQMDKIFIKLNSLIDAIGSINYFPVQNVVFIAIKHEDFFRFIDGAQKKQVEKCRKLHDKISLALIQLESLILHTNSGTSIAMAYYYKRFKNKLSNVLIRSVLKSTSDMRRLLDGQLAVRFHVECYLCKDKIELKPTCKRLFESVKLSLLRLFTRLKHLKSWTCRSYISEKQPLLAEFYRQLIENEEVARNCAFILDSSRKLCDSMTSSTLQWLKYSILWQYDRDATVTLFASVEKPNLNNYEARYEFYSNLAAKIEEEPLIVNVLCVNIEVDRLVSQLREYCDAWKLKLSSQLFVDTKNMIFSTSTIIQKLSFSLNDEITDGYTLTKVLSSLNEIWQISDDVNLNLYSIDERYFELTMQNFEISGEHIEQFERLKTEWERLYKMSMRRKFTLEPLRKAATNEMSLQINKFLADCLNFTSNFSDEYVTVFKSLNFDARVEWILKFKKFNRQLRSREKQLQRIRLSFEIASYNLTGFANVTAHLEKLDTDYKLVYEV